MQDEHSEERGMDRGGTAQPEYSDRILKCVQTYRDVTTLRPNNGARVVDYVT